ncbi:hypothetical protein TrVE_jg1475 [Triparma verrucosa]|uniref:Uncharacterized protein n=1 Tax=Triparma verrucosa TaxID=1606542 RepID=A0A9W7B5I3_9STRA|nr:hypothetical protein TrVE_jg1475 [Triparma verrucosa]
MLKIFKRKRFKRSSKANANVAPPPSTTLQISPKISYDSSSTRTSISSSSSSLEDSISSPLRPVPTTNPNIPPSPPSTIPSLTTSLLPHIRNLHQTRPTLHELRHRLRPMTSWRYYWGSNKGITDDLFLTEYHRKRSEFDDLIVAIRGRGGILSPSLLSPLLTLDDFHDFTPYLLSECYTLFLNLLSVCKYKNVKKLKEVQSQIEILTLNVSSTVEDIEVLIGLVESKEKLSRMVKNLKNGITLEVYRLKRLSNTSSQITSSISSLSAESLRTKKERELKQEIQDQDEEEGEDTVAYDLNDSDGEDGMEDVGDECDDYTEESQSDNYFDNTQAYREVETSQYSSSESEDETNGDDETKEEDYYTQVDTEKTMFLVDCDENRSEC